MKNKQAVKQQHTERREANRRPWHESCVLRVRLMPTAPPLIVFTQAAAFWWPFQVDGSSQRFCLIWLFLFASNFIPPNPWTAPPPPQPPCEVLFVKTDSRLALNIHGDVSRWRTQSLRGEPLRNPGPGSQAVVGSVCVGGVLLGSPGVPAGRHHPTSHTQVKNRRGGQRDQHTHRCSSMQMYEPPPTPTHKHICCPPRRSMAYTLNPPEYAPFHPDTGRILNGSLWRAPPAGPFLPLFMRLHFLRGRRDSHHSHSNDLKWPPATSPLFIQELSDRHTETPRMSKEPNLMNLPESSGNMDALRALRQLFCTALRSKTSRKWKVMKAGKWVKNGHNNRKTWSITDHHLNYWPSMHLTNVPELLWPNRNWTYSHVDD